MKFTPLEIPAGGAPNPARIILGPNLAAEQRAFAAPKWLRPRRRRIISSGVNKAMSLYDDFSAAILRLGHFRSGKDRSGFRLWSALVLGIAPLAPFGRNVFFQARSI